jgi:serine protease Do
LTEKESKPMAAKPVRFRFPPEFLLGIAAAVLALAPAPALRAQPVLDAAPPTGSLSELSDAFRELSVEITPAVVQVFVVGYGPFQGSAPTGESLIPRRRGSGSGVILDPDGYVITNHHVVQGAERIQVRLSPELDDRPRRSILKGHGETLGAQVIGVDAETDLAVLKIDRTDLPFLELADSDDVGPGEIVLAFGSPLGLENTVTMGVVSSVARQLADDDPMVYIQTDATINPGNSGGPLVDARGRVIGINTLIFSPSGGGQGIGFAAPSNIVKNVYEQIRSTGRVRRGEIGIYAQTIDPLLARGLGLDRIWGVIAGDVFPGGPANLAGIRTGDILLSLDGKPMENGRQFDVNLYRRSIGDVVVLEVLRGSERLVKRVPVIERGDDPLRFTAMVSRERNLIRRLGILAIELDAETLSLLPALRRDAGILVAARADDALGGDDGLFPGDVIYAVNGAPVTTLAALRDVMDAMRRGQAVALQIERNGSLRYAAFALE